MIYDVVTIGSATVDQFADTDSELIRIQTRTSTEELIAFPLGSKLLIKHLTIQTGGGGTNSAVAFARLGLKTAFLGKIGEDGNGEFIVKTLYEEGVEFIGAREGTTGISVILDSIADDRSILAFKGANNQLRRDEIAPFNTRWLYMSSMLDQSFETVVDLVQDLSCKIAFNPSNYQAELGYKRLRPLIDRVNLLIMNKEEAAKFLGLHYESDPDPRQLMREMAVLPPELFVITDGSRGVYVYDRDRFYHALPRDNLKILETTGAGDAFASSFTATRIWGLPIEEGIHWAMCNAESVLQYKGAKERLLSRDALAAEVASSQRQIHSEALVENNQSG